MADRQGEIDALVTRTIEGSPRTQWVEGGTELEFFCPVGHPDSQDPHAYWNRRKGTWYCQKCGAAGSTYELAKTLNSQLPAERKAKAQDCRIVQTYDYKDAAGKHRFRLKASNGQIIASGEAYESRASALKGIESVRKNAPDATLDDQTT